MLKSFAEWITSMTAQSSTRMVDLLPQLFEESIGVPLEYKEELFAEFLDEFSTLCKMHEDPGSMTLQGRSATALYERSGCDLSDETKRRTIKALLDKTRSDLAKQGQVSGTAAPGPVFATSTDFTRGFMGDALDRFIKRLRADSQLPQPFYHREILVVQSSGSGKSRLITEVTKRHLGILLNVGTPSGILHSCLTYCSPPCSHGL